MAYNNNAPQRPRKRVTRQVLRRRQFTALAVIGLIVLLFVILIAKGCSKDETKDSKNKPAAVTTTTQEAAPIVTEAATEAPTEAVTTENPAAAQVQLSKREIFVDIGQSDVSIIQSYPSGSSEANEVWESKDPTIASVDNYGHITGVSAGETYVILKFSNNPGIEIAIKVYVADNGLSAPAAGGAATTTTTAATTAAPSGLL